MTMQRTLVWLYLANATVLISHEIDSAYWKEWRLFWGLLGARRKPLSDSVGASGFVLLHLPLVAVVLWGMLEVAQESRAGLVMSVLLAASGVFAFTVHTLFNRAGHPEFRSIVSRSVLWCTLALSITQIAVVVATLNGWGGIR